MPRVVPSQVVAVIDKIFTFAAKQTQAVQLTVDHAPQLAVIVDLVDQIPDELIILESPQYNAFRASVAVIRNAIMVWLNGQTGPLGYFTKTPGFGDLNPVTLIRQALFSCPDEYPSTETVELTFISDQELRESLRIDISAVNRALSNGEWKAATVLAGSVLEALLLWKLQRWSPVDIRNAVNNLLKNKVQQKEK